MAEYPIMRDDDCLMLGDVSSDEYKNQAFNAYLTNESYKDEGRLFSYNDGHLVCFCNYRYQMKDVPDEVYSYRGTDLAICADYRKSQNTTFWITQGISYTVIGINLILWYLIIYLVDFVGYGTISELQAMISWQIFVATYLNSGLLMVIANADTSEHTGKINLTEGKYNDYSVDWYEKVGMQIVYIFISRALWWPLNDILPMLITWAYRAYDRCLCIRRNEEDYYQTR